MRQSAPEFRDPPPAISEVLDFKPDGASCAGRRPSGVTAAVASSRESGDRAGGVLEGSAERRYSDPLGSGTRVFATPLPVLKLPNRSANN